MADRPVYDPSLNVLLAEPLWLDTAYRLAFGPLVGFAFAGQTIRFRCETRADITVPPRARVELVYDATDSRWDVYPSKTCT